MGNSPTNVLHVRVPWNTDAHEVITKSREVVNHIFYLRLRRGAVIYNTNIIYYFLKERICQQQRSPSF